MRKRLFAVLFFWPALLFGQTTSISPYSGFGLGELAPQGYDRSFAMGGVGLGFNDSLAINPMNPASYSFFKRKNPIFQVGLKGQYMKISSEINTDDASNFAMNDFALGMPVGKGGAFVLGINPATNVGYNLVLIDEYTDAEGVTFPVINKFKGSGGFNKFYLGMSQKLYERTDSITGPLTTISVGGDVIFYGGTKNIVFDIIYADSANSFNNTRFTESERIRDFGFDFGFQAQQYFNKRSTFKYVSVTLGATVNIPKFMSTKFKSTVFTYKVNSRGEEVVQDSIFFIDDIEGDSYIPIRYAVGIMIDINKKWQIGIDYSAQNWSEYKQVINNVELKNDNLTDMFRTGIGFQFNPAPIGQRKVNTSYLKLITYRAGFRYYKQYLKFGDYQLDEKAISLGLNLPFSKSQSFSSFNLGIEFGTSGTIDNGLVKQNFINFMIGLTLLPHRYNRWFVQRKFK